MVVLWWTVNHEEPLNSSPPADQSLRGREIVLLQLQLHQSSFTGYLWNTINVTLTRESVCDALLFPVISRYYVLRKWCEKCAACILRLRLTTSLLCFHFAYYRFHRYLVFVRQINVVFLSSLISREQQLSRFVFEWRTLWGESPAFLRLICLKSVHI